MRGKGSLSLSLSHTHIIERDENKNISVEIILHLETINKFFASQFKTSSLYDDIKNLVNLV